MSHNATVCAHCVRVRACACVCTRASHLIASTRDEDKLVVGIERDAVHFAFMCHDVLRAHSAITRAQATRMCERSRVLAWPPCASPSCAQTHRQMRRTARARTHKHAQHQSFVVANAGQKVFAVHVKGNILRDEHTTHTDTVLPHADIASSREQLASTGAVCAVNRCTGCSSRVCRVGASTSLDVPDDHTNTHAWHYTHRHTRDKRDCRCCLTPANLVSTPTTTIHSYDADALIHHRMHVKKQKQQQHAPTLLVRVPRRRDLAPLVSDFAAADRLNDHGIRTRTQDTLVTRVVCNQICKQRPLSMRVLERRVMVTATPHCFRRNHTRFRWHVSRSTTSTVMALPVETNAYRLTSPS
jgi:hypothetical protein